MNCSNVCGGAATTPTQHFPHLTAIHRTSISAPAKYLLEHNLLHGSILDFGCGYGADVEFLHRRGFDIIGYDSYFQPILPDRQFDTILCTYVLNVLDQQQQEEVMQQVKSLLTPHGAAFFTVRRDLKNFGYKYHKAQKAYTLQTNVQLSLPSVTKNAKFEIYQWKK